VRSARRGGWEMEQWFSAYTGLDLFGWQEVVLRAVLAAGLAMVLACMLHQPNIAGAEHHWHEWQFSNFLWIFPGSRS